MNVTLETLAAIFRVGGHLVRLDGEIKREEVAPITDFFNTFEGMDEETMQAIVDHANNEMTDGRALDLITAMEPEDKQQIADLFAKIVCADGVVTDEEKEIYQKICSICGLPAPGDSSSAEEHQEPTLSQRKIDLNNRVLQVLSKAKFDNKTAGQAASLVAGFCGRKNAKRDIYTAIVKLFGQKKGLEIYRCIKGTI